MYLTGSSPLPACLEPLSMSLGQSLMKSTEVRSSMQIIRSRKPTYWLRWFLLDLTLRNACPVTNSKPTKSMPAVTPEYWMKKKRLPPSQASASRSRNILSERISLHINLKAAELCHLVIGPFAVASTCLEWPAAVADPGTEWDRRNRLQELLPPHGPRQGIPAPCARTVTHCSFRSRLLCNVPGSRTIHLQHCTCTYLDYDMYSA